MAAVFIRLNSLLVLNESIIKHFKLFQDYIKLNQHLC